MNNCICAERGFTDPELIRKIMEKSAAAVGEYQFDGLKLDSCSQFNNLTWWASLLNKTGRAILIENCHQGGLDPPGLGNPGQRGGTEGNCLGTTEISDCPYNLYRTSGDINPNFAHMMGNVNTVVKFLGTKAQAPLSRPGAWAYPDVRTAIVTRTNTRRVPLVMLTLLIDAVPPWLPRSPAFLHPALLGLPFSDDGSGEPGVVHGGRSTFWALGYHLEPLDFRFRYAGRCQDGALVADYQQS